MHINILVLVRTAGYAVAYPTYPKSYMAGFLPKDYVTEG
jgi:hypothetical protein